MDRDKGIKRRIEGTERWRKTQNKTGERIYCEV